MPRRHGLSAPPQPTDTGPGSSAADPPVQVVLSPAARLLWRGPTAVQLELGATAVVLDGVAPDVVRRLVDAPTGASEIGAGEGVPAAAFAPDALRTLSD